MKGKNFRESLIILFVLLFALASITFGRDLEESKYHKEFVIARTTIINVPKSTSGYIFYKLPKGSYRIEITSLDRKSTMHLDDALVDTVYKTDDEVINNNIGPYFISAGHYKFKVKTVTKKTYKQGFRSTVNTGKLLIKIIKIK